MALSPAAHHRRAKFAKLSHLRAPDDPELIAAHQEFKAQLLADHVERNLHDWPPLTDAQIERIAALLRAGAGELT
jgi:hypothetical protein